MWDISICVNWHGRCWQLNRGRKKPFLELRSTTDIILPDHNFKIPKKWPWRMLSFTYIHHPFPLWCSYVINIWGQNFKAQKNSILHSYYRFLLLSTQLSVKHTDGSHSLQVRNSDMAQWIARWAHNPEVPWSKLGAATFFLVKFFSSRFRMSRRRYSKGLDEKLVRKQRSRVKSANYWVEPVTFRFTAERSACWAKEADGPVLGITEVMVSSSLWAKYSISSILIRWFQADKEAFASAILYDWVMVKKRDLLGLNQWPFG